LFRVLSAVQSRSLKVAVHDSSSGLMIDHAA
jgi:hypothetical protein